jgi:hypothetical protein
MFFLMTPLSGRQFVWLQIKLDEETEFGTNYPVISVTFSYVKRRTKITKRIEFNIVVKIGRWSQMVAWHQYRLAD